MSFIEIESRTISHVYNMNAPVTHEYFELYFLLEGKREVFVNNKMFVLDKNSLCIIPPFSIHKTEGDFYTRINIYISQDLLTKQELKFLSCKDDIYAYQLTDKQIEFISPLLKEATKITLPNKQEYILSYTKVILSYLMQTHLTPYEQSIQYNNKKSYNETILKIVNYINKNYKKNITLSFLSNLFYISVNVMCKYFKKEMNTTINQYILLIRFNHAKIYLLQTNKTIEEISELCGFSSSNYFSLIFKKSFGISPQNYRKKQ